MLCDHRSLVFQNFIEFYKLNGSKSSSFPVNERVLPNDAPQRTLLQDGCLRVETGNQSNFIFRFHLNPEGGIMGDTREADVWLELHRNARTLQVQVCACSSASSLMFVMIITL